MVAVMRDLKVLGTDDQIAIMIDAMTKAARAPWSRHLEGEENIGRESFRVFMREADSSLPAANVAIHLEPDGIEVVNIVPYELNNLEPALYNAILQEFLETLVQPAADAQSLAVVTTTGGTSLAAEMSPEIARLLESFSGAANKSTGSSHPLDFRRWAAFLIASHRSGRKVDTWLLEQALKEQGWSSDRVSDLVSEFEFSRDLLTLADRG